MLDALTAPANPAAPVNVDAPVIADVPVTVRLPPVVMSVEMVVEACAIATTNRTAATAAIVTGRTPLLIDASTCFMFTLL